MIYDFNMFQENYSNSWIRFNINNWFYYSERACVETLQIKTCLVFHPLLAYILRHYKRLWKNRIKYNSGLEVSLKIPAQYTRKLFVCNIILLYKKKLSNISKSM